MDKIRVLHVIQNLNVGGLERIAAQIAAGLDRDKFEAELWCLSGGGPLESLFADVIPIKTFDYKRYLVPWNVMSLSKRIKEGRFDIVHTHSYAPGIFGRLSAKLAGVKVIIHHHHSVSMSLMNARHSFCERFVTKYFTDKVLAVSNATKEFILEHRFAEENKIAVIYNGVPVEFEKPSGLAENFRQKLGLTGKRVLAAVGSLTPHKGHIYLLEAFRDISKTDKDIRLVIAGEGPEREKLEIFIEANGLVGKVILAGSQSDVRPLLETADIFVLPSLMESMSISCAEAMAKKLPVIASRTGGVTEVVKDGETGLLAEPGNAGDFAKKITTLLGSETERKRFGENGYKRYKDIFTFQRMLDNIQHLYLDCLSRK